jgi:MFS transporter, FHS family, Na+ dependent glucose transporter 1
MRRPALNIMLSLKYRQVAVYYVAFVLLGITSALLGPTLNTLSDHAGVSLADISILFTAFSVGYLGGSLLGGRVYDRVRGHPVAALALLIVASMLAVMPLARSLWLLIVAQFVMGLAASMLDVGANTLLVWAIKRGVGPFMNALHLSFGIGSLFAPLLVSQSLTRSLGIDWAYWTAALLALPIAALTVFTPSPVATAPDSAAVSESREARVAWSRIRLTVIAFFFLIVAAEAGMAGWLFSYASASGRLDDTAAAAVTSGFWAAFTIGRLIAIPIAARVSAERILMADLLICVAGAFVLWLGGGTGISLWIGAIAFGLGVASLFATMVTYVEQRVTLTAAITSVFFVGASLGSMTVPWLMGQLFESPGPWTVPAVLGVVSLLAFACVAAMRQVTKRTSP